MARKYRKEFQTCDQLKTEILGAIDNYERHRGELGVRVTPLSYTARILQTIF